MFTASLFNMSYTPDNNRASIDILSTSSLEGYVKFDFSVAVYGFEFIRQTLDPCDPSVNEATTGSGLAGMCPMTPGKLNLHFTPPIPANAADMIPSIAYNFPDLDATVRIYVNKSDTGKSIACVEADVSNGKTVNLVAVKWVLAVIAGLTLCASAILNGLGHSNAAAHIASGALSLFGFFQGQAMLGLTGVHLPPVVQSWTQDFQWSMGIIKVPFMQNIFTWYQRATGGEPSHIFNTLTTVSVQVEKRGLHNMAMNLAKRGAMQPKPSCRS